jgi:hypothetical protein
MKEALKLALEALESIAMIGVGEGEVCEFLAKRAQQALASVDEALAQPAQEPVAWGFRHHDGAIYDCISPEAHADCEGEYTVPLYATPPAAQPPLPVQPAQEPDELTIAYMNGLYDGKKKRPWVGLTEEERRTVLFKSDTAEEVAIGIEAKLKEKNT